MVERLGAGGGPLPFTPVDDKKVASDLEKIKEDVDVGSGNLAHDVRQLLKDEGLLPGRHHGHNHHHVHHQGPKLSMDGEVQTGGQAGSVDETRLQKALAEIRDVSSSGIDLLARVMLEQQGLQRHEAVQDRVQMRTLARESLLQAAGELNKQADAMQTAAVVQLVVACVTAAVTIVAAGLSAGLSKEGNDEEATVFANTGTKLTSNLTTAGSAVASVGQSAGKLGEAMGAFAGTEGQIAVKQSEANQKIDEANAQQYEAQADLKKGTQDAFDDNMKQIIEFVKELKDAVADLQSAITRHA